MPVILVIDEHSVYRSGLREVIEARVAHSRVIEASTFDHSACNDRLDLVLIDSGCLVPSSASRLRELRALNPRTSFALTSISHTRSDVLECLSAGFHGFIYKFDADEELLVAINDLLSGRMYVPRWLADETTPPEASGAQCDLPKLTRRQNEILPLLAKGMSNKEIAKHLNIAPGTTKIHTTAVLRALEARNRTEAAFVAARIVRSRPSSGSWYNGRPAHEPINLLNYRDGEPATPTGFDAHNVAPARRLACSFEEKDMTKFAGAVPWLRLEDWSRWQQIDPAIGHYDSWLKRTSEAVAQAESAGMTVEAVTLDPETFLKWCGQTNHQTGLRGRSAYAAAQLMWRDGGSQSRLSRSGPEAYG